ncbi:MAG: response regulator, partial [Lachnospiraceae bacterium]|nr:response regulator [Lachnospiraceae bacterium]
ELILRETDDPTLRNYAINIQNSGKVLLNLINDILDFSKIEAGKTELFPDEYNPAHLVSELYQMLYSRTAEKGLTFVVDLDPALPHMLYGDFNRIRQIILNLLTNAVKYTKSGEVMLAVSYQKTGDTQINLEVSVSDTGIGIKKEDIERLFFAFERIEEERNRAIEGTGLGMNIVRRLLELMGSRLNVESEYGKGSTFSFALDQKVIDWTGVGQFEKYVDVGRGKKERYEALFSAPNAKILLVDDTDMNLFVAKGLLKHTELQIDTAVNGKQALSMTEKNGYDLLLVDHRMPVMDGVEMIQSLRSDSDNPNQKKPCVILTANAVAGARDEYLASGFDDYLVKPITGLRLEETLLKYLPPEKIESKEKEGDPGADEEYDSPNKLSVRNAELLALEEKGYLNTREGLEYTADEAMYLAAVGLFAASIDQKCTEIDTYYENEDWKNYQTKVHALKSSARVIGAERLSELSKALELAVKDGDLDYVREHHSEMLAFYGSYKSKLNKLVASQ